MKTALWYPTTVLIYEVGVSARSKQCPAQALGFLLFLLFCQWAGPGGGKHSKANFSPATF